MNFPYSAPVQHLPIDDSMEQIVASLSKSPNLLLIAPPGTGKTTRVAPRLTSEFAVKTDSGTAGKTLLIQPRRIAARTAAGRIAHEQSIAIGQEVGYHVRFDKRTSKASQLICMTPGILLRRLQSDPVLDDVSVVVLDEFHERSLEYDLLAAMLRKIQVTLRDDLRLIVMSATIEAAELRDYLPGCSVITMDAVSYPVKLHYQRMREQPSRSHPSTRIVDSTVRKLESVLSAKETPGGDSPKPGHILTFLPGVGEIRRVARAIEPTAMRRDIQVFQLYGAQSPQQQNDALANSVGRKLILATNVAETSLTIDGVTTVVDSGFARVQRIDPSTGLNRLVLEPISMASADQRAGRAGRTAPGVCHRLWDEVTGRSRAKQLDPEILRVELSSVCLQLACWGEDDVVDFGWLTKPLEDSVKTAVQRLVRLGALQEPTDFEASSVPSVTKFGRQLSRIPAQPAIAACLLAGQALGVPEAAAQAAALLSERDILRDPRQRQPQNAGGSNYNSSNSPMQAADEIECDILRRISLLQSTGASVDLVDKAAVRQVGMSAQQLQRELSDVDQPALSDLGVLEDSAWPGCELQLALLRGFPDRLARRRSVTDTRGVMVGGRGVKLATQSCVRRSEFFLCLDVDGGGTEATVRKAVGIPQEWLKGAARRTADERFFNPTTKAISTRRREYWLDLLIAEHPLETPRDEATAKALAKEAAKHFRRLLPTKDKVLHQKVLRCLWLSAQGDDFSALVIDEATMQIGLEPWCAGKRSFDELARLPWKDVVDSVLGAEGQRLLKQHAPESIRLPTGRNVLLSYEVGKPPILAARIQELFGWPKSPRLAGGKAGLLFHLLAPNGRCHQITDSLESFWANTYPSVRKELRGRYPKHAWPEDPHA